MISPTQLKNLCSKYNLSPIFFKSSDSDDIVISLDGTYPNHTLSIYYPEDLKLWSDAPDYPDPNHPWRLYIPRVSNEIPADFHWITLQLFHYKAYQMETDCAPYQLTEEASLPIVRSIEKLLITHEEIIWLFPWLSDRKFALPPLPRADILQTRQEARSVEVAIGLAGLEALDLVGLFMFCSYNHHKPLRPSPLDDVLSWSQHELCGVVLDLETMTFKDLVNFVKHHVPVYYICCSDSCSPFPPKLINAKDRDGELEKACHNTVSENRVLKARARGEHRAARLADPSGPTPLQQRKRQCFLKHNNRFKEVSKNIFTRLHWNGTASTHNLPTRVIDILDLDNEPTDDQGFSDTNPISDIVRGPSSLSQSSQTLPPLLFSPFTRSDEPGQTLRTLSPHPQLSSSQHSTLCPPRPGNCDHLPCVRSPSFAVPTTSILRVPPRMKCCLRLWLHEHPNSALADAIPCLLAGGFSFRILTNTVPAPIPLLLSPQSPHLNCQGLNSLNVYRINLVNILCRPNARRFLTYGRVLWRLALHYSETAMPQNLVMSMLNGPTIAASLVKPGFYDDEVSDKEVTALLGTATDGSTLWPPKDVFYNSDRWAGRWTPDNESWFQKHFVKMSTDIIGCFKTHHQWLKNGFQTRRKAAQNIIGSEDYAKGVCLQYDADFSPFPPA